MIGVGMGAHQHFHMRKPRRIDHPPAYPHVRLLRVRVLPRQRIRKVWIDTDPRSILDNEPALPQPPKIQAPLRLWHALEISDERVVAQQRLDHSPSSLRTTFTPSTILVSFCFAAQRAVWLKPQSGAKLNLSAGAYLRQRRTRSATSAIVST